VDLLRGDYPLALLPEHDASDPSPVRISKNALNAKFVEFLFQVLR
jgi:hypothetical protein